MKLKANAKMVLLSVVLLCATRVLAVGIAEPFAITYSTGAGNQQIWVFVATSPSGHLFADMWDGNRWTWRDLGQPSPEVKVMRPKAITYVDPTGIQQIHVFVTGSNGNLFVDAWNGSSWTWFDLGWPHDLGAFEVAAITYADPTGVQQIRAFVTGVTGHLFANAWNGESGTWLDLGAFQSGDVLSNVQVITYADGGAQHIRAFAIATDFTGTGRLVADAWDGDGWTWFDLGAPDFFFDYVTGMTAMTYADAGIQRIRVFVSDFDLYADAWDGSGWAWFDLGQPQIEVFGPTAISYADSAGNQHLRVFATVSSEPSAPMGRLVANAWDGSGWTWFDLGQPWTGAKVAEPTAITYQDATGVQQIRVFATGSDGDLIADGWSGDRWTWFDLGQPTP